MTEAPWKDAEQVELDEAAIARITDSVKARGPGLVVRGRRIDRAKRVGVVAGVCGAAVLTWMITRPVQPVSVPSDVMACSDFAPADSLDLGVRGVLVADGEVTLKTALPCRTVLELRAGRVTILAEDLGGGELVVVAGPEEVVVRGTLFSVERDEDTTLVSTEEGVVEVVGRLRVAAGFRARVGVSSVKRETLDEATSIEMRRRVGLVEQTEAEVETAELTEPAVKTRARRPKNRRVRSKVVAPPPTPITPITPPTPNDLIRLATAAKKAGDFDTARRHFKEAGGRSGQTAEAAWLGLARMEMTAGRPTSALDALAQHDRRFPRGDLGVEAAWLKVLALKKTGDRSNAEKVARSLVERWPSSSQARQARRFLGEE